MRYAALLLLAACCPPSPTTEDVHSIYNALWQDYVYEYALTDRGCWDYRPITHFVPRSDFPAECGPKRHLMRGCTAADPDTGHLHVWVDDCDNDPRFVVRHEGLHVLLTCLEGKSLRQANHVGEIWAVLGVEP